ncbi:T9SS type B sorting domain-containing protein [Flavobacterium sp. 20NA77.7]|uniref:T9SS type B sorting domain-containing protein n=1 Tax=Flavobacterium nakdongensis TaxID=3073563 RepID=A0ABY9R6R7_9FLAO|nr:T9SS type B sorting domain-containing protein [Flavobacterium sp. 20NA77.7]WMW76937.1 T9SS type B sorting domain-containing protein [Flavobacterium sp. 20NA77.7]
MITAKFTITIKLCISIIVFLMPSFLVAQNIFISQGGIVNVTGGETFYDAGGLLGNDGNTSYTITLMPPSGKSVCVDFTSFSSFEALDIFDGTSVSSTNIGSLKGNYSLAYNATGSPFNTGQPALGGVVQAELKPGVFCANNITGALTFRFTNLSASQSTGWEGLVTVFNNSVSGCTIDLVADKTTICPSQSVTLTATGTIGASALDNTFNTGVIGTGWNATPGGVAFVSVLSCQPNNGYNTNKSDNSIFAWMQNVAAPRILESNAFDVSNGGVISFDFRAASDDNGGNGCEANDDKEGIYVQYSTDNGLSWVNMKLMFPSVESNLNASANIGAGTYVYNWNKTTFPIPLAAQTTNTKFRWYQHQSTTGSQDSWGIDDVKIIRNKPVTLTITDLSTNTVIATTTSATISTIVSPTVTTNYRATITDGVSSCFEDITINVTTGSTTSIAYPLTTISNTNTTIQTINVTNGPVTGNYSATPSGLTINSTTGAVTPNTSSPGTYTISVPTSCGVATTSITITNSTCSTCANATCPVVSIQTTTAALGQTGITTALNTAGDQLATPTLLPGQNITICVPVTVPVGTSILGFKQLSSLSPSGCASASEEVITYQLKPASNCSGAAIVPNRTNASSVTSGFNPEWDGLASGNYILCFTLNVTSSALCTTVDLQGLGYYTVIPSITCQDYQIQMYDDDTTSTIHTGTTFACSDTGVYLGPVTYPTVYDGGLPFPALKITITATSGNLNNLVLNRYDAGNNTLAEVLTVPANGISNNYFLRPSPGQYYKLDKTNTASGTYNYIIMDVISGVTVASGIWTIVSGAESAASNIIIPQGTATYSGPGVSNGFDPTGLDDYTNDRGIGFFNPSLAGPGTHTITYTWNNGLAAPNNCTLTRTKTVTVTVPTVDFAWQTTIPTASNLTSCNNTCYGLKAKTITQVGTYIQPGFTISDGNGNISYSSILIKEGSSAPVNVGTQKIITYCVPTYAYVITLNGTDFATGSTVTVSDNATATILFSGVFSSGMQISLPPNSIKGTAVFSGPGVSNVKVGQASDYIGSGYGCFNPSLAGVGTHTITYSWNNGFGCTGTKTMQVTVTGTSNPTVSNFTICSGSTASLTAGSISTGATVSWYSTATGGTTIFTGNPFTTPILTSNTSYWVTQTLAGCESSRVKVDVTVNPNVTPTFTQVAAICSGATLMSLPTTSNNGITGNWSPALNNTTTTTYTFTPTSGQCATTATMTITVNPNVTPTFTQVGAICSGTTLTALPTTSNNGITGSWSPALNNTTTTTYTFTPTSGQCATTATMTITVNPNITPTFTQVGAICSGTTLTALPTTSNNGITGSWLPALNNTTTTTYTFTPTTGQCATTATMTITVNPNVTPTFSQVGAICSGTTLTALPTTSNNGITGSWSPALNNTTTTTYTFTPTSGQCATTATMTITVNPNVTPTFTQVGAICSGTTLTALPTTSNNGITGSWLPALNNTTTTTYTFTPTSGQCATTATMTITVNLNVTPTFTQVAAICSGTTLTALPTTSSNGITGSWLPALNNTTTTTYTFTPDSGQCATTATMTITVNPNVTPTFTQVAAICSGATLTALPTTSSNGITGSWLPALNNTTTTTYTFTPDSGQCTTTATMTITVNPNVTPTFTQVAAICSGATLTALPTTSNNGITGSWSPVLNNTTTTTYTFTPDSGQCATTATMTITVNPNVTPTFTQVAAICSGATLSALPTTSNNSITGSWSPVLNNTTTTTYTFTPDSGQCATTATMTITVNNSPQITFSGNLSYCNGATSSILLSSNQPNTTFTWNVVSSNLSTGTSFIVSGTGSTISQQLALLNNLNQGFVTYLVTPSVNGCIGNSVEIPLTVNPIPTFTITAAQNPICSGEMVNISFTSTIAATQYSWTVTSQVGVTGALSGSGQSINQILLATSPITSGTVTYLITPSLNGCMGIPKSITITVNPKPEIIGTLIPQYICSGESTNITVAASIVGTQFSWQVIDANQVIGYSNGTGGVIQQILTTVGDLQGYVIYEVTPSLNGCIGIPKQYKVFVNPLPKPVLINGPICVSISGIPFGTYELNTGLNTIDYQFSWFLNGNLIVGSDASLVVTQPGTYLVKVKNVQTNCEGQATALVFPITPATSMDITVSEAFADNPTITVNVNVLGNGNLMYQLDNGAYQESNVFYNVEEGLHEIHVIDQEGCTDLNQTVRVINYPKFFTPNGDGYNDTWNINGFQSEDNAVLYIFDRYGKLIKQLFPPGIGWDGTYIGQQLPSTDYWFTVEYTEKQQRKLFKSHFSLKR